MTDFEFSRHARDALKERKIDEEWIWQTIYYPDREEIGDDYNTHYVKAISERGGRFLHVVVNPYVIPKRIVTVFFDRRLKRRQS